MIHTVSLDDLLILEDELLSSLHYYTLDDAISFYDSIDPHQYPELIQDRILFDDRITTGGVKFSRTFSDTLVFTEVAHPRTHIEIIDEFLFIYDWLLGPEFKQLRDSLVFVDDISCTVGRGLRDTLTLTDTIDYVIVKVSPMTDSLTLVDNVTVWKDDPFFSTYPIQEP